MGWTAPWTWTAGAAAVLVLGLASARRPAAMRRVRGRALVCIGVFGLALAGCLQLQQAAPGLLGLPVVLAPGVAATAGLATFALLPWGRGAVPELRVAALEPRPALWAVRARDLMLPGVAGAALVLLLVACGVTAAPDDGGRLRAFTLSHGSVSSTASPYPGWYYAAPLLLSTALLVGAALLAMRRAVALPAITADPAIDRRWRRAVQRVLAAVAGTAMLLDCAGTTWSIGAALRSSDGVLPPGAARSLLTAAAVVTTSATPLLLVVAVVVLLDAVIRSMRVGAATEG